MDLKAAQKADTTISKDQVLKRMNFGMYFHSSSEMIESEPESVKAATALNATSVPNNQTPESK
jgi:hypothetical protein